MGAVIADRDVHRRTLGDDGPGWRALLNNNAVLVGGADHPTNLADSQANGGEFVASRCLPAVFGPQPQQVRHMPVLGMTASVVPDPEGSSDQNHAYDREQRTTHEMTMSPSLRAVNHPDAAWARDAGHATRTFTSDPRTTVLNALDRLSPC